jgi:hypothetical protein
MTLAVKNGGIVIKDGKLAESCNCCTRMCCCEFFDLSAGGARRYDYVSPQCVSAYNSQPRPCDPISLSISVSGIQAASVPTLTGFINSQDSDVLRELSYANTSIGTSEVCGGSGFLTEWPGGFVSAGAITVNVTTLAVYGWFSRRDDFRESAGEACANGSVRFRVKVSLAKYYNIAGFQLDKLSYTGYYKGPCTTIDSYSAISSMLDGKTVTMACTGTYLSPGGITPAEPQTITVRFSANPLP